MTRLNVSFRLQNFSRWPKKGKQKATRKKGKPLAISLLLSVFFQVLVLLDQSFLALLEVLNPTSSIHAFIDPFVFGKIKCVS